MLPAVGKCVALTLTMVAREEGENNFYLRKVIAKQLLIGHGAKYLYVFCHIVNHLLQAA